MKCSLLFFFIVAFAVTVTGQPSIVFICETDEQLHCPCDSANPLYNGIPACLLQDVNHNGPDGSDIVIACFEWCPWGFPDCCTDPALVFTPADPAPYYVRIVSGPCCWHSGNFVISAGPQDIELTGWYCRTFSCFDTPDPRAWTTIYFPNGLNDFGCPCAYPMQFPPGSVVELMLDLHPAGPTSTDATISLFEIAAGAGLPPWNGYWSPRPDSELVGGNYYIKLRSASCCWISDYLNVWDYDTLTTADFRWTCSESSCADFPCNSPSAPENFEATYLEDTGRIRLSWEQSGSVTGFRLFEDSVVIATFPGEYRQFELFPWQGITSYWITALNPCGESEPSHADTVIVPAAPNAVSPPSELPDKLSRKEQIRESFRISPNPFNPMTTIEITLPGAERVSLVVYDVRGRQVAALADGEFQSGNHRLVFDGADLPSGIYFARLNAGNQTGIQKLLLLK